MKVSEIDGDRTGKGRGPSQGGHIRQMPMEDGFSLILQGTLKCKCWPGVVPSLGKDLEFHNSTDSSSYGLHQLRVSLQAP